MQGANKYFSAAAELQRGVKHDELRMLSDGVTDYDEVHVRQAIVHTRQDTVLLVSLLSSLNGQIATIRRLLWLGAIGLFYFLLSRAF